MKNVTHVKAEDFSLICELDDGNIYRYDMSFVQKKSGSAIDPLKDVNFFKKVFIELGALAWPNGYEIHGDTVARDGVIISQAAS